jgi:hypothetical protein
MEVVGKGAKSLPDLKQRDVAQLACIVYEGYFDNIRSRAELCAFILGLLFVLANEMREP